ILTFQNHTNRPLTDFGGKTSIFSHPVYLFLREFSLQDFRGGSLTVYYLRFVKTIDALRHRVVSKRKLTAVCSHQTKIGNLDAHLI
ncbi:hypothetical protein MMO72_24900, partial [Escherichia coli]|uniref:hypothetical protein n=1 Tax=Escherichia coli TaxID=562 RepID=UPI000D154E6A